MFSYYPQKMSKFDLNEIIRKMFGFYQIFSRLYAVILGIRYAKTPKTGNTF